MNYNYKDIKGQCCTGWFDYTGAGDGQTIHWQSRWAIDPAVNPNKVKGYSFIGLTAGLEKQLSAIRSIPSTYKWSAKASTKYKGTSMIS